MSTARRVEGRRSTALAALWLAACSAAPAAPGAEGGEPTLAPVATGGTGSSVGGGSAGGVAEAPACAAVTARRIRRLSHEEYEHVVAELFGAPQALVAWSSPDVLVEGFDTNADALTISGGNIEDFALSAELLAGAADVAALAPCGAGRQPRDCAGAFVTSFAERAYGRPLKEEERGRLELVYDTGSSPDGYDAGIRLVIEAVLVSPNFLYRSEIGGAPDAGGEADLEPLEVASAVSFALTGARPDAPLRSRALSDPAFLSQGVLREEVARLAATPSARDRLARFLRGWLGIRDLRAINKIPILFPDFRPELKAALDQELSLFLDHVLVEGGTLASLLGSPITYANDLVLSRVYAGDYQSVLPPVVPGDGAFAPIRLDPARRRGVLSLGGWLAAHSPVHRTSPVDRGLAIRSRLFCQSLPPPPPGVLFTAPANPDGITTTRQNFELHTSGPNCRGCHAQMDPIGFGLEMMDAVGRYRMDELGIPVDSSGVLTDTDVDGPFRGPAELAAKLIQSREVRECFVTQLFRYVEGRDPQPSDECDLARLRAAFVAGDGNIARLLADLVLRSAFRTRRAEP